MILSEPTRTKAHRLFTCEDIDRLPELQHLTETERTEMKAVASVFSFQVNRYILDELISWKDVPNDPIYQLTFPQPGMLSVTDLKRMTKLIRRGTSQETINNAVQEIRDRLQSLSYNQHDWIIPSLDPSLDGAIRRVSSEKNPTLMAQYFHPRELETPTAQEAIKRVQNAGVTIRSQTVLVRFVNDSADILSALWRTQIQLGIVPDSLFIARSAGMNNYFSVPLSRALKIHQCAINDFPKSERKPKPQTLTRKLKPVVWNNDHFTAVTQ